MRIVAGVHKGRRLKAVPGNATRPTGDKVKEAVFQVIGPFFDGGHVLDLFAGSGALGMEALSRGMNFAVFIDKHPKAIHTIHDNLKLLRLTQQAEVYRNDAFRALQLLSGREYKFDLILLDPPYGKVDMIKLLGEISSSALLRENGFIFCEHDVSLELPRHVNNYTILKQSKYGDTIGVTIYQYSPE
jgi:16S rRNA (guanine966-N2)-methyltransferase